jgi:hypothetical protein
MLEEAGKLGPVRDEADLEEMLPIIESYGTEMVGPPLDGPAEDGA